MTNSYKRALACGVTGSVAYLDAKFKEYNTRVLDGAGNLVPVSFAGNRLTNSPKWNAAFGFNWKGEVGPGELQLGGHGDQPPSTHRPFRLSGPSGCAAALHPSPLLISARRLSAGMTVRAPIFRVSTRPLPISS